MQQFDTIAGSWPVLSARLDRVGAPARWALAEPVLAEIVSAAELPAMTSGRASVAAGEMVAALVRLAAVDGGDEPDAALVVVHLLRRGVLTLAARLGHRGPEVLALVVGELICQIRRFPWRTARPYPSRLLLDTKHALWRGELRPIVVDGHRPHEAVLVDPTRWPEHPRPAADADAETTLVDLLLWAAKSGIVPAQDLRLLWEFEQRRGYGARARERVAAAWGINERTLRRRRDRTLGKLRDAAQDYLEAAAA